MVDVNKIVTAWEIDKVRYEELGRCLLPKIKNDINELELNPVIDFRVKDLLSIVRKIKKKNLEKEYSYDDLKDKLGFRIICSFLDDIEPIDNYIVSNFKVVNIDRKQDSLDPKKLDYISNHYDVYVEPAKMGSQNFSELSDLIFEIQVRTLNQHAWSSTSHALSYKHEAKLSDKLNRKIFRLLSLYEIADDEFASVNNFVRNNSDSQLFNLLRVTEGKIYKYAKVDFDREITIHNLQILIRYFSEENITTLIKSIDHFIQENETKIRRIFFENESRFHEMTFLTQPEIFIIWFALDKFPFAITDNWNTDFEEGELEMIQSIWGVAIGD